MRASGKPRAICVGGPIDGSDIEMRGTYERVRATKPMTISAVMPSLQPPDQLIVEYVEYRFEVFYTPEGRNFYFAIPIGQSIEQTMQMLVDRYQEKKRG